MRNTTQRRIGQTNELAIVCRYGPDKEIRKQFLKDLELFFKTIHLAEIDQDINSEGTESNICDFCFVFVSDLSVLLSKYVSVANRRFPFAFVVVCFKENVEVPNDIQDLNISGALKDTDGLDAIHNCLISISSGYRSFSKSVTRQVMLKKEIGREMPPLTKQENKVIRLIAEGRVSNREIAKELFLSPHTVKNHKDKLVKKLKLQSVYRLYAVAVSMLASNKLVYIPIVLFTFV